MLIDKTNVLVAGAGAIGSWLGAKLQAKGVDVTYFGREGTAARLADGLTIDGLGEPLALSQLKVVTSLEGEGPFDWVILACKRYDTEAVLQSLAPVLEAKPSFIVAQNGLGAAEEVMALSDCPALAIMVPFNLAWQGPGLLHQGTGGQVIVPKSLGAFASAWDADSVDDMDAVLAGKLLLNLNNAVNGLCGLPLVEELSQQGYRQVLAAAQREALKLFKAIGVKPAKLAGAPPALLPYILGLPDGAFRRLAKGLLAMDEQARSSLQDDLEAGRPTEVAFLNGWVVSQGEKLGIETPVNRHLQALILDAEEQGACPHLPAEALLP
ncbi:2-dehydropantoate 2-reductase [Gallaecimonas kandeliae]|uniref:2-dehydropantoate 2-reductase n=1 Tax=Gallaecimonas kandeliae TaxID=3029055 RepID=UPI0026488C4C|nr:2-dehydropantoate 2-reductase [Gallaecimonas kandeliae]WKE67211.1 2-dehydropantoate 2-reductase [Gallaecimonas kandeliae]